MAELLVEFAEPVSSSEGKSYVARACGDQMADGMWQGWIEFVPIGEGEPVRSGRETTQPNRTDTEYWATGLTPIFLEGSLARALKPLRRPLERPTDHCILNPFSVYRKGETLLRGQLSAMSAWHLVNIVTAYHLSEGDATSLQTQEPAQLVELIIGAVREETRMARSGV